MFSEIQNNQFLNNIKNYLDLLTIALASLHNSDSPQIIINLNPENIEDYALIIADLAKEDQELLRRALNLWENLAQQNQSPRQVSLLSNYLEKFSQLSQQQNLPPFTENQQLEQFGLKLLIDLLFYSAPQGGDRLLSKLKAKYI